MKENKKELIKLIIRLLVAAALFVAVALNYHRLINIDVRALVSSAPSETAAGGAVIGIYALKGLVFVIPAALLYISVGMAFSPVTACAVNILGIAAELTVSYILGRFLGGDYVEKFLQKSKGGQKILNYNDSGNFGSVFLIRLLPVFPIDFTSLFFGSVKLSFPKYILFSLLGLAPRVILFTLLGDRVYELIPMELIIRIILAAIPFAAGLIVVRMIVSKVRSR